jgi:hypothetical protein
VVEVVVRLIQLQPLMRQVVLAVAALVKRQAKQHQ